ncbi:hypothetical protein NMG60_11025269 [Bertholletia excelsa]
MESRAIVLFFAVFAGLELAFATVYKVGDSTGWTTLGNFNYSQWAANKSFAVGDIILFQYHPDRHNVLQVTDSAYQSCNVSAPIANYTTGNDSISVTTNGHHFFLCGFPGHCLLGQKVDINVGAAAAAAAPGPPASGAASRFAHLEALGKLGMAFLAFVLIG